MRIVLASRSPRRLALLREAGFVPEVYPAGFSEVSGTAVQAAEVVGFNARGKCLEIAGRLGDAVPVLGADTVVVIDGRIIGKPKDAADAGATLHRLSGRGHEVLTGMTVAYAGRVLSRVSRTEVYFKQLTDEEINAYVASGDPLDKAGSYGIQDGGGFLVDHIVGRRDNVVGLDVSAVLEMLQDLGYKV